jgi:hypothetical protein
MPTALRKRRNLTNEFVERLQPPTDRQYDNHYDALVPGLVLRVNQGGKKAWHVLHYVRAWTRKATKAPSRAPASSSSSKSSR